LNDAVSNSDCVLWDDCMIVNLEARECKRSLPDLRYCWVCVLTAVDMNVAIFWNMAPCSPYVNRRFEATYNLHLQGRKSAEQETSVYRVPRGDNFLRNVCSHTDYTAVCPRIWRHSI
jgi:hypothetical protein